MGKVMSLEEAVRKFVKAGSTVMVGGGGLRNKPIAAVREIVRQRIGDLHLQPYVCELDADMLIGAGLVRKVEGAYFGLFGFGLAPNFRKAAQNGNVKVVDLPEGGMVAKFRAACQGLPFGLLHDLGGTSIAKVLLETGEAKEIACPFTGKKLLALPAASPDVAIVHAQRADPFGNAQWDHIHPLHELEYVIPAEKVILTVEELVDESESYRKHPERTVIPGVFVDAVVEVPWGAHPYSCEGVYDADPDHLRMYVQMAKEPEKFREYLNKYVYGPKSQTEYLSLVGGIETVLKHRYKGAGLHE